MSEWGVVGVIVVLIGLGVSIGKPILSLNTNITKLIDALNVLEKSVDRLWKKEREQDNALLDHEKRISELER